jgi:ribonuclease P/MRP protein subunit POP5
MGRGQLGIVFKVGYAFSLELEDPELILVKYLSPATSTFILRVSRAHYRIVWAALSFMNTVPVKNGKSCVFRVVRVSGTIRKAEEEAVRRARELILKARRDTGEQSGSTLDNIFGKGDDHADTTENIIMVDREDSDEEDEELSDGD